MTGPAHPHNSAPPPQRPRVMPEHRQAIRPRVFREVPEHPDRRHQPHTQRAGLPSPPGRPRRPDRAWTAGSSYTPAPREPDRADPAPSPAPTPAKPESSVPTERARHIEPTAARAVDLLPARDSGFRVDPPVQGRSAVTRPVPVRPVPASRTQCYGGRTTALVTPPCP